MVGRIYKGDYKKLLHTKHKSSGPHGFREKSFYVLPIVSQWELMTNASSQFGPLGHDLRDLCRVPINIVKYSYTDFRLCGFREENWFSMLFIFHV